VCACSSDFWIVIHAAGIAQDYKEMFALDSTVYQDRYDNGLDEYRAYKTKP
jgi:hypothetical protein